MKADVYYNLRKKCLSIRSREKKTYGKILKYRPSVVVKNAKFIVQPAGLKRARQTGVKNVHAFVRGDVNFKSNLVNTADWVHIRYNPFKYDGFVAKVGNTYLKVVSADTVIICGKFITAKNPNFYAFEKSLA